MSLRPSHIIAAADEPITALEQEIRELQEACDHLPRPDQGGATATLPALREALTVQSRAVAHEAARFALVLASDDTMPSLPSVRAVCGSLAEALGMLVSVVQELAASTDRHPGPAAASGAFTLSVRGGVRAVMRAAGGMAQAAAARMSSRHGTTAAVVRTAAGMVLETCDGIAKLPSTPHQAVRRLLLRLGGTLRDSAKEIRAEHPPGSDTPAVAAAVDASVATLRATSAVVKSLLDVCDALWTAAGTGTPNATRSADTGAADSGSVDSVCGAVKELDEACIDLAAAANDLGVGGDDDDEDDGGAIDEGDEDDAEEDGDEEAADAGGDRHPGRAGGAGGAGAGALPGADTLREAVEAMRTATAAVTAHAVRLASTSWPAELLSATTATCAALTAELDALGSVL